MATFVMEVGLPGSGKTYFAKIVEESEKNLWHLSSDEIRKDLWGDANYQKNPKQVFKMMNEMTLAALKVGIDVIYDATNLEAKYRKQILNEVKKIEGIETICLVFNVPLDLCIRRAAERDRVVPEAVIRRMHSKIERPQYEEGWDYICTVTPKEGETNEVKQETVR